MRRPSLLSALPALLALLAASCALPPYNEDLSLAQVTKTKMTRISSLGPVYAKLDDSTLQTEYYFLPDRNDPVAGGGFLINSADYGVRAYYLDQYSTSFMYSLPVDLDNESETANNFLLEPIESAADHYLSMARAAKNDIFLIKYTATPSSINGWVASEFSTDILTSTAVGSNIYPDAAAGSDFQYFLCYSGPGLYNEVECSTDTTDGVTPAGIAGPTNDLGPVPDTLTNAFYHHDPGSDRSFLSYWSAAADEYKNFRWTTHGFTDVPTDFQQLTGIKHRIDAVLTSGELLSFKNGACTVYSASGAKLYRFPLGGLRFCYERFDAGTPKLYFSLAYWIFGDDRREEPDQLYVEVYAIPTADLARLD